MNLTNDSLQRYSDVDIFSTDGRLGQKRYFVYSIVIPFLVFWSVAAIAGMASYLPIANNVLFYTVLSFGVIAMLLMTMRLTIQRCHDFNKSGLLAVFALIPFANVIFALIPGSNGLNQYGEVPKPANWFFKTSFYLFCALLIASICYLCFNLANGGSLLNLVTL